MPSSTALQQKTDEAESRETTPELPKPEVEIEPEIESEPMRHTQETREVHYQRQPTVPQKNVPQKKEKRS